MPTLIRQQAPHLDTHDVKALQDGIGAALNEFAVALLAMVDSPAEPEPAVEPDAAA